MTRNIRHQNSQFNTNQHKSVPSFFFLYSNMTCFRSTSLLFLAAVATLLFSDESWAFAPNNQNKNNAAASVSATKATQPRLSMARGRGSFQKEFQDSSANSSNSQSSSSSGGMATPGGANWLNTKKSVKELPEEEGKVRRWCCIGGEETTTCQATISQSPSPFDVLSPIPFPSIGQTD